MKVADVCQPNGSEEADEECTENLTTSAWVTSSASIMRIMLKAGFCTSSRVWDWPILLLRQTHTTSITRLWPSHTCTPSLYGPMTAIHGNPRSLQARYGDS